MYHERLNETGCEPTQVQDSIKKRGYLLFFIISLSTHNHSNHLQLKTQEFAEFKSPNLDVIASKGWNQNMNSGSLWELCWLALYQLIDQHNLESSEKREP